MNLDYPGGPKIDKLARSGDYNKIEFPQTLLDDTLDFSFSGLKSHVINFVYKNKENIDTIKKDVAAGFQFAVCQVIIKKVLKACKLKSCKKVALAGGVSANSYLRKIFVEMCEKIIMSLVFQKIFFARTMPQ